MESFFHSRDNSDKMLSASKDKTLMATIMIDLNSASARAWRSLKGKQVTKHGQASWVNGPAAPQAHSVKCYPKQA